MKTHIELMLKGIMWKTKVEPGNKGEQLDPSIKVNEKCKTQFETPRRDHGKALGSRGNT